MKNSYLALICGVLLFIVLSMAWCQPRSTSPTGGSPVPSATAIASPPTATPVSSPSPSSSSTAAPTETPVAELRRAADKTAPAVILVSVFDASGKLLRTGTGFFISDDGKFVTNRHLIEDGVNAIASTADKKIHNVTGVLAESAELDVAVLQAETKEAPSLVLNNVKTPESGTRVTIVGSALGRAQGTGSEAKIAGRGSDEKSEWLDLAASVPDEAGGSPVVNENGVIVGMVSLDHTKNPPMNRVVSANALHSFLAKVEPSAKPRWAAAPSPSPSPSPKFRKGKILYAPAPTFPSGAVGRNIAKGMGSYRILFDATGKAKSVQVLRSAGAPALDQAAVTALQQWKSDPGPEWPLVVPVSFGPRANN